MSQTDPTSSNDKKEEELSKFIDRIQSIPSTSMEGAGYVTIEQLHTVNEERLEDQEAILEVIVHIEPAS